MLNIAIFGLFGLAAVAVLYLARRLLSREVIDELQALNDNARGLVRWPGDPDATTDVRVCELGTGGTVVLAIVLEHLVEPAQDAWRHFPGLVGPEPLSPTYRARMLACVPLGARPGRWWHGDACPWGCTLKDLTDAGRDLVATLERLYSRDVEIVTWIDQGDRT